MARGSFVGGLVRSVAKIADHVVRQGPLKSSVVSTRLSSSDLVKTGFCFARTPEPPGFAWSDFRNNARVYVKDEVNRTDTINPD